MPEELTKEKFISNLRREHDRLMAAIAGASPDRMLAREPGGDGSAKDILAHITWYEREMVGMLEAGALVGSPLWQLPPDERNAQIYARVKDLPLERVLADSQRVFASLLAAVEGMDEADLFDSSRFAKMPPDRLPWQVIAGNTYEHIPAHLPDLEERLHEER